MPSLILVFLSTLLTKVVLGDGFGNLTIPIGESRLDDYVNFLPDLGDILAHVENIIIATDGEISELGDFLDDIIPTVEVNHTVIVYYFDWILQGIELCPDAREFHREVMVNHFRGKRWAREDRKVLTNFQGSWFRNAEVGYIVVISMEMLSNAIDCLINTLGIFVILIVDSVDDAEVLHIVHDNLLASWNYQRAYQIYVMLPEGTYTLHPFVRDPLRNNSFGVLMPYQERPVNIFNDFNGYPVRMDMFHSAFNYERHDRTTGVLYFEGADAEVMRSLRAKFNFTTIFQKPDGDSFGYRLSNGSFTGAIGRIASHRSDLAVTGFFVKDYHCPDMEFTMPVYRDELCCVVQKAKMIPKYWLPLLCFEPLVWICLLLTIIVASFLWRGIRWCERLLSDDELLVQRVNLSRFVLQNKGVGGRWWQYTVDVAILLASSPMRRITRVTSERVFLSSILLVSLITVSIFQSNLSTAFTRPYYYRDISTLKALDDADLIIGIKYKAMLDDLFPSEASVTFKHLRDQIKVINQTSIPLIEQVMKNSAFATVTRKTMVMLENAKYFRSGEVFLVPECPKIYNLAYVMAKHSVFGRRINKALLLLTRGGFLEKWIDDMNFNVTWDNLKRFGYPNENYFHNVSLADLQLPFYVLLIGTVFSFLVLMIEFYMADKLMK
ncbi:glutamate receptor [Sergentomyia squamirostris]